MKNETKLEKVKKFLDENNIVYRAHKERYFGHSDLFIKSVRVAIMIERDQKENEEFYETHRRTSYPVFIRESDTPKFVLEKVQNTIVKSMTKQQERMMRKAEKEENKKRDAEERRIAAERKAKKANRL